MALGVGDTGWGRPSRIIGIGQPAGRRQAGVGGIGGAEVVIAVGRHAEQAVEAETTDIDAHLEGVRAVNDAQVVRILEGVLEAVVRFAAAKTGELGGAALRLTQRVPVEVGKPKIGPNARPALEVKSLASFSVVALVVVLLARLKPRRNSFTTAGLKTWVSLSTTLRTFRYCTCGL